MRERDSIVSVWSTCLRSVGVYHKQEVRNRYVDSFGRPDIVTFDSGNLSNAEIDVSLAHPYTKELISTSAKVNGHAASVREKEKIDKYARFRHPGGFTPEVIRTFWEVGKWPHRLSEIPGRSVFRRFWTKKQGRIHVLFIH